MINLLRSARIFVCTSPTDMRRGFDGLCGMAEHLLKQDPLSGHLFVFRNRARNRPEGALLGRGRFGDLV